MRHLLDCSGAALVLSVALASPAACPAAEDDPAPFLKVAQQHYASKDGQLGVIFHVTADVSELRGKACTLIVHVLDKDSNPLKACRKEYSTSKGTAAVRLAFTPKDDDTKVAVELFMPYDAITAGQDEQDLRIGSNIWDDDASRYVSTQPFRAESQFDPQAGPDVIKVARTRFERDRVTIAREWLRHHGHRHGRHDHHKPHARPRHDPKGPREHRPHGGSKPHPRPGHEHPRPNHPMRPTRPIKPLGPTKPLAHPRPQQPSGPNRPTKPQGHPKPSGQTRPVHPVKMRQPMPTPRPATPVARRRR